MEAPLISTFGNRIDKALSSANDYHTERHRINKRLAKLRDALSLKNKNTKNYKKKEITLDDYEKNSKYADVLLLTIERDLIYISETKWVISVQSSKSKENFVKSKYKKCIGNLIKLLSVIDSAASDEVKLQAYTYAAIIQGASSFFRKRWNESLYSYSLARLGLQTLIDTTSNKTSSGSQTTIKEIATDLLVSEVDPVLKLSLYNSDTTQSVSPNLNQISKKEVQKRNVFPYLEPFLQFLDSKLLKEEEDQDMDLVREVSWSKFTVEIGNEDTARLITEAQSKSDIEHKDVLSYDPLLLAWQDLLEHHTMEMEKSQDELSDEAIQDNQILLTFINYKLNFLKIERDLTLIEEIESKKRGQALSRSLIKKLVKILSNVSQTLKETKELPGVYNDETIWKNLEIFEKYFDTVKLIKTSQSYLINNSFKESLLLLYKLSQSLGAIDVLDFSAETSERKLPTLEQLGDLKEEIDHDLIKLQLLTDYYNKKSNLSTVTSQYYLDNVANLPIDYNKLVNIKEFQLIHQKPVLFDVAFNYIDYSQASVEMQQKTESGKDKKTFFGLFGGSR